MSNKTSQEREPDDKEQSERFVETARKLESDESGESFERAFNKISKNDKPTKKNESS